MSGDSLTTTGEAVRPCLVVVFKTMARYNVSVFHVLDTVNIKLKPGHLAGSGRQPESHERKEQGRQSAVGSCVLVILEMRLCHAMLCRWVGLWFAMRLCHAMLCQSARRDDGWDIHCVRYG